MTFKTRIILIGLLILIYIPTSLAQQLSLGVEAGPILKSFNQFTPAPEPGFYELFERVTHNEGWVISYATPKHWRLTATLTKFFPSAGLITRRRDGNISRFNGKTSTLPDRTWSARFSKQLRFWQNRLFIEPALGIGFTNVKVRGGSLSTSNLLQLDGKTYHAGWRSNYQACLGVGYRFKKSSLSIKGIGVLGRKYYLTYHYTVNNTGTPRNVDIATKGDVVGLQLCYEYIFNLKKKK